MMPFALLPVAFPDPGNPVVEFFAFTGTIGDSLAFFAVLIAGSAVVHEVRKATAERASKVAVWAAIPHDRVRSAGIRGVVIANESGEVANDVTVTMGIDGAELVDVYPVVPPGVHFLPLQARLPENERDSDDPEGWTPKSQEQFQPYWMLPGAGSGGDLRVRLRDEQEMRDDWELRPWTLTSGPERFGVVRVSFALGNGSWERGAGGRVRRVAKRKQAVAAPAPLERRFPTVALSPEQEKEEVADTQSSYQVARELVTALTQQFTPSGLEPGSEAKPTGELRRIGIEKIRRSRPVQRGGKDRGGIKLDFYTKDDTGALVHAYSLGASEWGTMPQWFGPVRPKGATTPTRSFLSRPEFKARRSATDWTAAELAAAVMSAIRDDRTPKAAS